MELKGIEIVKHLYDEMSVEEIAEELSNARKCVAHLDKLKAMAESDIIEMEDALKNKTMQNV